MSERLNPTVRRVVLAKRLRMLREDARLSINDVAQHLLCSPSKVSRLETGGRGVTLRDVRDLCALYKVAPAEAEELMTLVREAQQKGWWQSYDEVASRHATYIGLEDSAAMLENYETIRIPGLLQTPEYTRALIRAILPGLSGEAVEQFVESRGRRQRLLEGDSRPGYWVIVDEAALRRQVGGPDVMTAQVGHLISRIAEGVVTLQIVPFDAGAHAGMEGSFIILRFREPTLQDVAYVEGRSGELFLNRTADLAKFRETLDHLRAVALCPAGSVAWLEQLGSSSPG